MSTEKAATQPEPDSREIDLLIPVLAKLGIEISRPQRHILAGFATGMPGGQLMWAEIYGGSDRLSLEIRDSKRYSEDAESSIRRLVELANDSPSCCADGVRWFRLVVTAPRRGSGGRSVCLVAVISPPAGELTPDFCEQRIRALIEFIATEWPTLT